MWDIAFNEGDELVPTERVLKAVVHCLRKFRELLEWCPNVTIRTTYPGLDSLVKKKHLAARISHLCTEIMSYPVTFKQVESLKVVAALDLGAHLGEEKDIL